MFENAKWIWAEANDKKDDRILVRYKFSIEKPPKEALLNVGASDSYHMYINGKPVIINGGLPRTNLGGFYDTIDIAKFINKGENVIGFKCHFIGNDYCGSKSCANAGLIAECAALKIYTSSEFMVYRSEGYKVATDNNGCAYADARLEYDAGKGGDVTKAFDVTYGSTSFSKAVEYGEYLAMPFGELKARELPNLLFDNVVKAKITNKEVVGATTVYTAEIDDAIIFAPVVEVTALGAEKITIMSDRSISEGEWGSNEKFSNGLIEYNCKNGLQNFESEILLSGTKLIITMPTSVKMGYIGYRKSYYDTEVIGKFECYSDRVDKLIAKCKKTLDACISTGFWDSPDRMRGSNLSALSIGGRAALCLYDNNILPLIKKSILDFINADCASQANNPCIIKNNAISNSPCERPYDSLLALGNLGIIASYYNRTGDSQLLQDCYKKAASYLLEWQMEAGKVVLRKGDCGYIDSGYNIDNQVIITALYFSACKFTALCAKQFSDEVISSKLEERANLIEVDFDSNYFDGTGYKSGDFYDDRAIALTVLVGLGAQQNNKELIKILTTVKNASVQTEGYVLEALVALGAENAAQSRMLESYAGFADSTNLTMSEFVNDGGALCYSGSVGLISFLFGSLAGVKYEAGERVTIKPKIGKFDEIKYIAPVKDGTVGGLYRSYNKNDIIIENNSLLKVTLALNDKITVLTKGKTKC